MFSMRFSVSMAGPVARSKGFATLYAISCVIAYGQIRDKAARSFFTCGGQNTARTDRNHRLRYLLYRLGPKGSKTIPRFDERASTQWKEWSVIFTYIHVRRAGGPSRSWSPGRAPEPRRR